MKIKISAWDIKAQKFNTFILPNNCYELAQWWNDLIIFNVKMVQNDPKEY